MEEAELDDFFAKKDKSKKKAKAAKFTSSDILAKQSEKPKKTLKKKKEKEKSNQSGSTKTVKKEEDDEWADYEEEAEKDFSDLKIQKLQIGNKEEDGDHQGEASDSDGEGGEGREKREIASGPWNKSTGSTQKEKPEKVEPPVEKDPPPPPPKEAPKPTGKYIPPAARRAMEAGGSSSGALPGIKQSFGRRKKQAPNVMSEEDFPTLGGAQMESSSDGVVTMVSAARFEQVRGGGRQVDDPQGQSQRLVIGNKFDALSSADS